MRIALITARHNVQYLYLSFFRAIQSGSVRKQIVQVGVAILVYTTNKQINK